MIYNKLIRIPTDFLENLFLNFLIRIMFAFDCAKKVELRALTRATRPYSCLNMRFVMDKDDYL